MWPMGLLFINLLVIWRGQMLQRPITIADTTWYSLKQVTNQQRLKSKRAIQSFKFQTTNSDIIAWSNKRFKIENKNKKAFKTRNLAFKRNFNLITDYAFLKRLLYCHWKYFFDHLNDIFDVSLREHVSWWYLPLKNCQGRQGIPGFLLLQKDQPNSGGKRTALRLWGSLWYG